MNDRHSKLGIWAAIATVAGAGLLVVWRASQRESGPPSAPLLEDVVLAAVSESKRAFADIDLSECGSPEQAQRLLKDARVLGADAVSTELQAALQAKLGTWLSLRASDDVEAYIDWMEAAGNIVSVEAMQGDLLRQRLAKFAAASPVGEVRAPQDVVRVMWWLEHDFHDGYLHIRKIAQEPSGAILSFSRLTAGGSPHFPGPADGVADYWYGYSTICGLSLWDRPNDWQSVVESHGEVIDCLALLVCEGATGSRFPIAVRLFYDPARGVWWIDSVAINSVDFAGPGISF